MYSIARTSIAGLMIAAAALLLTGCSDSGSCGPGTSLADLYVYGECVCVTGDPPEGLPSGARISIYHGSETGPVASDLEVEINEYRLTFDAASESYVGAVPALEPGDEVTISVSEGRVSLSRTVSVPYAPFDLQVSGDAWDISGLSTTNTLTWSNPAVLGTALDVRLFGFNGEAVVPMVHAGIGTPTYTELIFTNWQLTDYETLEWVSVLVAQMVRVEFPTGPGVEILGGAIGEWQTVDGAMGAVGGASN